MAFDIVGWLHWLPHPRLPEEELRYAQRWLALLVVSIGVFLIALDITVVGVTAPLLSTALGATASQVQWSFDAYTVVLAGLVVLGGGLAERYGRKSAIQIGLLVFAAGAAISAFAPSIGILILGRAISGVGAAMIFPTCLSIISHLFLPDERPKAIGIFAAISAIGLAFGPVIGGIVIDLFWWGAAFFVVVPVAALALFAVAVLVPPTPSPARGKLDLPGAVLSVLGLGGVVFGVIEGPDRGWTQPIVLVPFLLGIVSSATFITWELRHESPLFDLRVFRDRRVVGGALAMATVYFTFNSSQLLLPQYLRYVLDMSSIHVGLMMAPFGLGLALLAPFSSGLVDRFGQRAMLMFALAFMAAGMGIFMLLPVWGGITNVLLGATVFGIGFGSVVAPATAVIMVAVPKEKAGDGSAVNMVSRQIGGAIGVAITGSVATLVYRSGLSLQGFALTPDEIRSVERSLSGLVALHDKIDRASAARLDAMADASMVNGVAAAMAISTTLAVLVAAVGFVALRGRD